MAAPESSLTDEDAGLLFETARPARTFENVVSQIRDMISKGRLKPGDKLPAERDLSVKLGVGRNAVREALRALEQAGIVDLRQGKTGGAFVTSGKPDVISESMRDLLYLGNISFDDLWETRLMLSDSVVQLAAERMTEADITALETNVDRAEALFEAGRLAEKSRCNIDFHDTLTAAAKNPMLSVIMASVSDLVRHFTERLGSDTGPETMKSRRRFLAAIREGDTDKAKAEMRADLTRVHDFYQALAASKSAEQ